MENTPETSARKAQLPMEYEERRAEVYETIRKLEKKINSRYMTILLIAAVLLLLLLPLITSNHSYNALIPALFIIIIINQRLFIKSMSVVLDELEMLRKDTHE